MQEAELVVQRVNQHEALRARLTQAAVSATPSAFMDGKVLRKLQDGFSALLTKMTGG